MIRSKNTERYIVGPEFQVQQFLTVETVGDNKRVRKMGLVRSLKGYRSALNYFKKLQEEECSDSSH